LWIQHLAAQFPLGRGKLQVCKLESNLQGDRAQGLDRPSKKPLRTWKPLRNTFFLRPTDGAPGARQGRDERQGDEKEEAGDRFFT
jgi:hypothetical protein